MMIWWNSLSVIEQVFAFIAIPATVLLLLQTILLIFSFGGDHSADSHDGGGHDFDDGDGFGEADDFDGGHIFHDGDTHQHDVGDDGLRIFTVRGFVAFFCIFGWSGLVFLRTGMPVAISMPLALILGFISMALIAYIMAQFLKLQANGAADIKTAVGVSGTVYITIPPQRSGVGKVSAVVSGRYAEYEAVTDEETTLKTNSSVTVVGITGANTLVVIKK